MKKLILSLGKQAMIATFLLSLIIGTAALAQTAPSLTGGETFGAGDTTVRTIEKTKGVLENIVGWIQIFFYIVATLMIILAAWSYLTAGGDETKVTGAKNKVIYALVAIAIAIIAGGVVTLVRNFVG